jgi:hypothetical protein
MIPPYRQIFQAFYSALPIAVYVFFAPFSVHYFDFSLFPMYQRHVYRYIWDLIHRKQWKKLRNWGEVTHTRSLVNCFIFNAEASVNFLAEFFFALDLANFGSLFFIFRHFIQSENTESEKRHDLSL